MYTIVRKLAASRRQRRSEKQAALSETTRRINVGSSLFTGAICGLVAAGVIYASSQLEEIQSAEKKPFILTTNVDNPNCYFVGVDKKIRFIPNGQPNNPCLSPPTTNSER